MADSIQMPPREVDVDFLEGRMQLGEPELFREITATRAYLESVAGEVAARLRRIQPLTTGFCAAFAARVDAMDPAADPIREQLEDRMGITTLWKIADRLRDSHPKSHPESGPTDGPR